MHVFVFYFLLIAFSILVYLLFSYSAFRLQECSIKSVSQSDHPSNEFWRAQVVLFARIMMAVVWLGYIYLFI